MKKIGVLLLVFVLVLCSVNALEQPQIGQNTNAGNDYISNVDSVINQTPVDPTTGKLDFNRTNLSGLKSSAEKNIDSINLWFDNHPWLVFVFGMSPKVSWLFAINIFVMLIFIDILVFMLPRLNVSTKIPQAFPVTIGLGVFLALLWFKFMYAISVLLDGSAKVWWARFLIVIALIFVFAFLIKAESILQKISKARKEEMKKEGIVKEAGKTAKKEAKKETQKAIASFGMGGSKKDESIEKEAQEEADIITGMANEDDNN